MTQPLWHDDELTTAFAEMRHALIATGWIRETTPSQYSRCPWCQEGEYSRVQPIVNRQTGLVSLFVPCAECGIAEVSSASLRRWILDVPAFVESLVRSAEIRGSVESFANGHGWFLGRAAWGRRSHEVFLLRALSSEKAILLRNRLDSHPKAILFTPTSHDALIWRRHGSQTVLALDALLTFQEQVHFDTQAVEAALYPDLRADRDAVSKRKKADLLSHIDLLKQELIAHLRAAKDYAYHKRDLTGDYELLERPGKAHLGERVGLRPDQVTRCFQHKSGAELKILWELANDLDRILHFAK